MQAAQSHAGEGSVAHIGSAVTCMTGEGSVAHAGSAVTCMSGEGGVAHAGSAVIYDPSTLRVLVMGSELIGFAVNSKACFKNPDRIMWTF